MVPLHFSWQTLCIGNEAGFFAPFHTLYVSGDHGPHFHSAKTMYNESSFFAKYGKKMVNMFLCSYHAYNRCDSAGVESKRIAKRWKDQMR